MMFAQANSEHCRHKIFNAELHRSTAQAQDRSMFAMIRNTEQLNPQHTVVAYTDNASVMEGHAIERWRAAPATASAPRYAGRAELAHVLMKVETHNHPTAISPFPGASTGAGGEIRDEGATGRGSKPKAGLTGFSVSNLHLPGTDEPWERSPVGKPEHIASALQIMIDGPLGGAAFNNEFGRPEPARLLPRVRAGRRRACTRGYHKPIMIAGGLGAIRADQTQKIEFPAGTLLVQLGGPGMRIGMGGGAASSMAAGTNTAELDFDSVQRGNPEIQRRAQEVINQCWQLGAAQPDPGDPRRRRRRPVATRSPSWSTAPARGATLRPAPGAARGVRPGAQGNLVQREPGALRAGDRARVAAAVRSASASASAARSRWSACATEARQLVLEDGAGGDARHRHADGRAARQAAEDAARRRARRARRGSRSTSPASTLQTGRVRRAAPSDRRVASAS